jgi:hypothetical protein
MHEVIKHNLVNEITLGILFLIYFDSPRFFAETGLHAGGVVLHSHT